MCGPAVTIEFDDEPIHRHLLSQQNTSVIFDAKDSLQPGDIIVNAALGRTEYGTYGDVLCYSFKGKGAAGLITDGVMKDTPFIRTLKDFPVYTHMGDAIAYSRHGTKSGLNPITATDYNVPVKCDRTLVRPGDIILADESVIVIPTEYADQVAKTCAPQEELEALQRKLALTGMFKGTPHVNAEHANRLLKSMTREMAERFDLLEEWKTAAKTSQ